MKILKAAHDQDLFNSRGRDTNVSAKCILILLWQLETHFADFQDEKVHFIGTTTVAMESFFHLLKLHKVRLI